MMQFHRDYCLVQLVHFSIDGGAAMLSIDAKYCGEQSGVLLRLISNSPVTCHTNIVNQSKKIVTVPNLIRVAVW